MGNVNTAGPNEALVISGSCCSSKSRKFIVGGWGWSWCCVSQVDCLSLNVITIKPTCKNVETSQGVPLTVAGCAQIKIMYNKGDKKLLTRACENFIGRSIEEIEEILQLTLEGHLRAIVGQMTVEEIYKDRETFAQMVRETATPDIGKMGIQIISFVVQEVRDKVGYLTSIGKAQTAVIVKDATVGKTNAERDAKIHEAQCAQAVNDAVMTSKRHIDNARKLYMTLKAQCDTKINAARCESDLAYNLQKAKEEQVIRNAELEVEVIRRRKQIEVEHAEVERRERELQATERSPAEFDALKVEILAEGDRKARVLIAEAEAQKIRLVGLARAQAIKATGSAEAAGMQLRAQAMQAYGREALVQMVWEALPTLAAEISSPLQRTEDIVLLGGQNDRTSTEIGKLLTEGPAVVGALTGVDITNIVKNIPGATVM